MKENLKQFYQKHKRTIWISIISIFYTAFLICLTFFHENWRDEAQAWLMCRDLSFIDLLKQLKIEGHPCLWYLILFPFAKLGFPYHTMNIISALLIGASVFLILKKAPFHISIKILIMTSIPFIYQHSIIARNYSLIPLIISLLAIYYFQKNKHPFIYGFLLVLLFNTHSLMLGLGLLLCLDWIIEFIKTPKNKKNKNTIISLILVLIALGLVIAFYHAGMVNNADYGVFSIKSLNIPYIFKNGLNTLHYFSNQYTPIWYKSITGFIMTTMVILLFIVLLIYNKKQAIIYLGAIAFQWIIFTYSVPASPHRVMVIVYVAIFCSWLVLKENKKKSAKYILTIILLIFFINLSYLSIKPIRQDIQKNYSSSKDMAQYLNNNISGDYEIIGIFDFKIESILPYLPKKIKAWSPITKQNYTFITWNEERNMVLKPEEMLNNITEHFSSPKALYYIFAPRESEEFKNMLLKNKQLKFLYKTRTSICGESYELYQLLL